ncbi:VOC family protein [Mariniblastus fucicola]|uniref:Glyoxalase-like domain protein n=1 Tax=Mariniblastus fucicola TaxID=980251 RepID=A0A5B9PDW0_9BACT|nr:VOC family protein [Mariniblastus fucicola]QEG23679.1 Glyoxalase-like domain protein [Mariniblastus fucicola]
MSRTIIGAAEIVLSVSDLPKMREFYVSVLGFPIHGEACSTGEGVVDADSNSDSGFEATITFLTISETDTPLGRNGHPQILALIDYRRHFLAKGRFDGHDVRRSTLNHLAFEILPGDYDSEFERLSELGLNPTKTVFANLNAKAIFFKDPEGNVLELICHDADGLQQPD